MRSSTNTTSAEGAPTLGVPASWRRCTLAGHVAAEADHDSKGCWASWRAPRTWGSEMRREIMHAAVPEFVRSVYTSQRTERALHGSAEGALQPHAEIRRGGRVREIPVIAAAADTHPRTGIEMDANPGPVIPAEIVPRNVGVRVVLDENPGPTVACDHIRGDLGVRRITFPSLRRPPNRTTPSPPVRAPCVLRVRLI